PRRGPLCASTTSRTFEARRQRFGPTFSGYRGASPTLEFGTTLTPWSVPHVDQRTLLLMGRLPRELPCTLPTVASVLATDAAAMRSWGPASFGPSLGDVVFRLLIW